MKVQRGRHGAVSYALKAGYRHLDYSWFHQNEDEVGGAVRNFLAQNPSVKRSDLFITTKVWNHLHEPEVKWSLESSLEKLQIDYVDLFLLHWPTAAEKDEENMPKLGADGKYITKKGLTKNPKPIWRAMEKLYTTGKARAIGDSNLMIPGLKEWLRIAKVKPAVNQIEIHPFLPNTEPVEFCFSHGILPEIYSPLGSQGQVPNMGEKVRTNPALNKVAGRSGGALAQVLLAWGLRWGYVVLPKSSTPSGIDSNLQVPTLNDADFEVVSKVVEGRHTWFINMKDTFGYDVRADEK